MDKFKQSDIGANGIKNIRGEQTEKSLRILYLTHYFPPEANTPAVRVSELGREWILAGHRVTVQTGFPNHPTGIIPERFRGKVYEYENLDGIDLHRSYIYAAPNKGILKRIANYLSFMFSTLLFSSWRSGPVDVVIGTSPQFFVAVAAWVTALIKRAPFVFEVRDMWPEEIVAVGAIKNRLIIGALEKLEMFFYRRAKLIVAVAQGTIDTLVKRGIPKEKLALIPNGVSLERFNSSDGQTVRRKLKLNGEFLVSYIGTHGMAHCLETVIEAAEKVRNNDRIKFMMVGDGAEKNRLVALARDKQLDNVKFVPSVSAEEIPNYYNASDVCLAPLRKTNLFTRNIPSKLYEIMAAERPIALGAVGESKRLVSEAKSGVTFEPENSDSLVEQINYLFKNREETNRLGKNGLKFVESHCQRTMLAKEYIKVLQSVLTSRFATSDQ